jgi:hypothetical protein
VSGANLDWPANSSDLNPIEPMCNTAKELSAQVQAALAAI